MSAPGPSVALLEQGAAEADPSSMSQSSQPPQSQHPEPPARAHALPHPLEDSARLAWQATAAVGLLERFGDLLAVALDAVGSGHDARLAQALAERERVMVQLEPLLAALAAARHSVHALGAGDAADATDASDAADASDASWESTNARRAIAGILRPVDDALRHAQLLHMRLADEVADRARPPATAPARSAPIALVR